ncbi:NAD(P)-binding protein, partial [Acaromyces ingoldii]
LTLITGVTGFVAAHVLDAVLASPQKYRVRGTMRSMAKKDEILNRLKPEDRERVEFVHVEDTASSDLSGALDGVKIVFHVASPFQIQVDDVAKDLLDPALDGTLNVLQAAQKQASVKKIVITSSFAAVTDLNAGDTQRPGYVYTEKDWNPATYKEAAAATGPMAGVFAYYASKKLAEKAAYDFVKENKSTFEIASINPPVIYGPTIQPGVTQKNLNLSSSGIYAMISSLDEMPGDHLPLYCDVRDVALAHVLAVEKEGAMGSRYLTSGGLFTWPQAAHLLAEKRPELKSRLPKNWEQVPVEDVSSKFASIDTSHAQKQLGLQFRSWQSTFLDSVDSLVELEKSAHWSR